MFGFLVKEGAGWAVVTRLRHSERIVLAEPRSKSKDSKQQVRGRQFLATNLIRQRLVVEHGQNRVNVLKVDSQEMIHDFFGGHFSGVFHVAL